MPRIRIHALASTALAALLLFALAGCTVTERDKEGKKKVDIESPFGGVHVRTDVDAAKETGIPLYPGARPKRDKDNEHSANVDIGSSFFGLKVVAASFETDDPPEKVLDFYRDKLKSYGNVLECKGGAGSHQRVSIKPGDSKDLTCDDNKHGINISSDSEGIELKVGTTDRAHVVSVKPRSGGSEFALVYVQTRGKGDSI